MHGGHPKILWPNAPKQWRDRCSGADGAWTRSREVMAMTTTEKLPHLIPVSRSILLGIENGVKRFLRLESVSVAVAWVRDRKGETTRAGDLRPQPAVPYAPFRGSVPV